MCWMVLSCNHWEGVDNSGYSKWPFQVAIQFVSQAAIVSQVLLTLNFLIGGQLSVFEAMSFCMVQGSVNMRRGQVANRLLCSILADRNT